MSRLTTLNVNPEGFVFDPGGGDMYSINSTGMKILNGLRKSKTISSIAREISNRFRIKQEQVEKDIFDFKCQLRAFKLI